MARQALIVFSHPYSHFSRINVRLLDSVATLPGVKVQALYELYPDFVIDVPREQTLLQESDIIIFQHPFYWYSCPPLMKEWIDSVLQKGFAYGSNGGALHGKKCLSCITSGGTADAYSSGGSNRFTMQEFLRPFEQTAYLCGMEYLPPFVVHGSYQISDEALLEHCTEYRARIEKLLAEGN